MKGEKPVHYIDIPEGMNLQDQGEDIAAINALAMAQYQRSGDEEILSKISSYEMAYRMQSSVPEATSIEDEPDLCAGHVWPGSAQPEFLCPAVSAGASSGGTQCEVCAAFL